MQIKISKNTYNADWCNQIAFKGKVEDCNILCDKLGKENVQIKKNGNNLILKTGGFKIEKVLNIVKNFPNLKVCAFLDEFDNFKNRKTYAVYSETGKKSFTQIKFIGICDGQDDIPFSEEADLLQSKEKKYTYTLSSTGLKNTITYHFPFALQWEDKDNNLFELDGDILNKYIGNSDSVVIPISVTSIESKAFENNKIVKEIYIPKSVKIIRDNAFYGCTNLEHVTIENGVTFIGKHAFAYCESLEEIIIPDSMSKTSMVFGCLKDTSYGVFEGCKKLKKITLSKKLKSIPEAFFSGCENLQEIILPNGISTIESNAFKGCKSMRKIVLPNGLKKIGGSYGFGSSFKDCKELNDIFIPPTVNKIEYDTFEGCSNLTIHSTEDSYASKYAKEHNIKFICEQHFPEE